ncbi:MAG: ribonucleotide-diphosphate reductase subunit beta [Solirubrobacteraceae bacterium]|nr:ribonucleotide-diphosphate reductase subunit beta [Solirubrobacteraceae bacterium]
MATAIPSATEQISYTDLYARWEAGNWSATQIDFSQDRIDWHERLTEEQRRGMLWFFTLFFHGEDSVADNLSPYIDAAPTEEQTYFLTTQQVDEARHSVFFHRFMDEVIGVGDGTPGGSLAATEPQLSWGHRMLFARLDRMADELRADRSKLQLAKAVTLYHVIVEASMAQPGQHIIEDRLEEMDILPGFREGMRQVAMDEQRHIAFGVRLLADLHQEDPETICPAILETIAECAAWGIGVSIPPGMDRAFTSAWGFEIEDLVEEAARSNEAKLRAIGLPIDDLGTEIPWDPATTPRERAERAVTMYAAGYIGPRDGEASRDEYPMQLLFEEIARSARTDVLPPGSTIQWSFSDATPWYVQLDNGSTAAHQGRADKPTLTLDVAFDDWVDVIAGRTDPRSLLLRRKLRPKGDLRALVKLPRLFG